jgi:hypothetical protein
VTKFLFRIFGVKIGNSIRYSLVTCFKEASKKRVRADD